MKALTILSLGFILFSCGAEAPAESEVEKSIKTYINAKQYQMQPTESGVYVEIIEQGKGRPIRYNDQIDVIYRGEFLDGEVFDQPKDTITFRLKNLIPAWKEVLIGKPTGTKLRLVTPPSMGYGDQDNGVIPPYSTLFFELEVVQTH